VVADGDRHDLDAVAEGPRPPAQVEVVAEGGVADVEPTEPAQGLGADQHPGRRHVQHVALPVVLALVELARLERGLRAAEAVDRLADLLEHRLVGPLAQLGTDDRKVRVLAERLEHARDGVGRQHEVVVQQQDEIVVGQVRSLERRCHGPAEADVAAEAHPQLGLDALLDDQAGVVARPVVHDHQIEVAVGLPLERVEDLREPLGGVVGDQDCVDARNPRRPGCGVRRCSELGLDGVSRHGGGRRSTANRRSTARALSMPHRAPPCHPPSTRRTRSGQVGRPTTSMAGSGGDALEAPSFSFRQAAPDTEALVVLERVVEALITDSALRADPLGLPGRPALLRKEGLGVGLEALRVVAPGQLLDLHGQTLLVFRSTAGESTEVITTLVF
jgi:hypothetical protein